MVESWITSSRTTGSITQFYLTLRVWDGYDKPLYFEIYPIDETEKDLTSGRFKNFEGWVDLSTANCRLITIPKPRINEVLEWIFENVEGKWSASIDDLFKNNLIMSFNFEEDDAMAFKLTFSDLCYELAEFFCV